MPVCEKLRLLGQALGGGVTRIGGGHSPAVTGKELIRISELALVIRGHLTIGALFACGSSEGIPVAQGCRR